MAATWITTNTAVERLRTYSSVYVHTTVRSLEPHRAWIDDVVQIVENSRGHLRQEHILPNSERKMANETIVSRTFLRKNISMIVATCTDQMAPLSQLSGGQMASEIIVSGTCTNTSEKRSLTVNDKGY